MEEKDNNDEFRIKMPSTDSESENGEPPQCRVCYGTSGKEVLEEQVCLCAGNMRYICLSCLVREIQETQNIQMTPVPRCSSCHHPFQFIRYQVGPLGQFRSVEFISPRRVTSFSQYLRVVSERDYWGDGFILIMFAIVVSILLIFNILDPWIFDESLFNRIMFLVFCTCITILWFVCFGQWLYELRAQYRDYRDMKSKRKKK